MPPARRSAPPSRGTDDILRFAAVVTGVIVAFGFSAWLFGNLVNICAGHGSWAPFRTGDALLRPHVLWPRLGPLALLVGTRLLPGLATSAIAVTGAAAWLRMRSPGRGMATRSDLAPLLAKEAVRKAQALRPSLAGRSRRGIASDDLGLLLGTRHPGREEVRASWEDVLLAVMAPRSGKTSALAIPMILAAPGPVMLTSNKAANDAFTATIDARSKVGRVWTLDPQQIAHHPQQMWWDILADARDIGGAKRLAGHFASASVDGPSGTDFWSAAATNTLAALFLAAASHRRPVTDVLAWLASPADRAPTDLLTDAGHHAVAAQLRGTVSGATETRDGIYETARQYATCLLDPEIAAWVTPDKALPEFEPGAFATSRDTLYLLSKDGGASAKAIIAAAADAVMRAAVAVAERSGGRLDPPAVCILDEAANVCRITDLPDLYSHLGSRGVIPVTILQSYRQGQRCWGEAGMDALWSTATIKLIGPGIDDADFADRLSRLVGDHEVETATVTTSPTGHSTSTTMRTERALPPDAIRALPKGKALLLATGIRPALLNLKPWYRGPSAKATSPASRAAAAAITNKAQATADPKGVQPEAQD